VDHVLEVMKEMAQEMDADRRKKDAIQILVLKE
jgi:hypothetical protein